jgi:hypothetical protein
MKKLILFYALLGVASFIMVLLSYGKVIFLNGAEYVFICLTFGSIVAVAVFSILSTNLLEKKLAKKTIEYLNEKVKTVNCLREADDLLFIFEKQTEDFSEISAFKTTIVSVLSTLYSQSPDLESFCQRLFDDNKFSRNSQYSQVLLGILKAITNEKRVMAHYEELFVSALENALKEKDLSATSLVLERSKGILKLFYDPFDRFTVELGKLKLVREELVVV